MSIGCAEPSDTGIKAPLKLTYWRNFMHYKCYMMIYQWADWNDGTRSCKLSVSRSCSAIHLTLYKVVADHALIADTASEHAMSLWQNVECRPRCKITASSLLGLMHGILMSSHILLGE